MSYNTHDLDLTIYMSAEESKDLKEELGEAYNEMAKFSEELCKKLKSCKANRIKLCKNLAKMYDFLSVGYAENKQMHSWFQACQAEMTLRVLAKELELEHEPDEKYPHPYYNTECGLWFGSFPYSLRLTDEANKVVEDNGIGDFGFNEGEDYLHDASEKYDLPDVLSSNGGMYHFYMLFWEFKMAEPDGHPELEVVRGCIKKEVE